MTLTHQIKKLLNENLNVSPGSETTVQLPTTEFEKFFNEAGSISNIAYSIKLDGVRCLTVVDEDFNITYLSRNKKEFFNFDKFDNDIRAIAECLKNEGAKFPIELDGEIISNDPTDKSFSRVMTQIRRINSADPSVFFYYVFDIVDNDSFKNRYDTLKKCFSNIPTSQDIELLPHYTNLKDKDDIFEKANSAIEQGEEGLVFKTLDGSYERKRSNEWYKFKSHLSEDLEVVDVQEGTGKYKGMLGALVVDYKGKNIPVGTGFTDMERMEFWNNPPIGKLVEIKYYETTKDGSLRFPVFMRIREEK